jgi:pimeloyl-ACP methyl ester carboxylesterase
MKDFYQGKDFWKNYMEGWFGGELIEKWERTVKLQSINSIKGDIGLEIYDTGEKRNPTIVFAHGIAGYARLLLPFLMPLYEKGFNIIAPDLEGFGYNSRVKGDFCWDEHLHNLKDAVGFARKLFGGQVYLGGGSMGGPLAYATDARYDCADGLICWCLWDFADREFIQNTSTTKKLTYPLIPIMNLASVFLGKLTFRTTRFVSYQALTSDARFNSLIMRDPQSGNTISLRGVLSLVLQSKPDLAHKEYQKPVLVCQPSGDEMTPSFYTQKVFDKLGSRKKRYAAFPGAHFPTEKTVYADWVKEVSDFVRA